MNSPDFVDRISKTTFNERDRMISFNVLSLFTKVLMRDTGKMIASHLAQDDTLNHRTILATKVIIHLLEVCLKGTYFQLEEYFYDQGMTVGSPLSPVMANIFMEAFENQALQTFQLKPKHMSMTLSTTLDSFHDHLKQQYPPTSS